MLLLLLYITTALCAGGPGSGKGCILDNLSDIFRVKVISFESCIIKHLPKKVCETKNIVHVNAIDIIFNTCDKIWSRGHS